MNNEYYIGAYIKIKSKPRVVTNVSRYCRFNHTPVTGDYCSTCGEKLMIDEGVITHHYVDYMDFTLTFSNYIDDDHYYYQDSLYVITPQSLHNTGVIIAIDNKGKWLHTFEDISIRPLPTESQIIAMENGLFERKKDLIDIIVKHDDVISVDVTSGIIKIEEY